MDNLAPEELASKPPFRPLKLIMGVLLTLLLISAAAQWYARNITMPRYCEDPAGILARVRKLLTEERPAGDGDRKPYIIAARLTFLIPRESNEPLESYMDRLTRHIDQQCQ
ncbi:MAG: hypothetical protein GY696_02575 [Gammaproteobacteria bacterium]|nr:hypothetical protein [Gammaproteobacteria bacterium]